MKKKQKKHFTQVNDCNEFAFAVHLTQAEILFNERNEIYFWKMKLDLAKFGGEKISIQDSYDIDKIMSNKEFVQEYNKAISYGKKKIGIDFGNAYWNAKGIVAQKKTSSQMIIDVLKNIIKTAGKLSDNLSTKSLL